MIVYYNLNREYILFLVLNYVTQIALVDFLESIGITPEGMIGHSAGEVGCAYADGTLTAEEAVFTAYYRGRSILEANLDLGAMAAIGKRNDFRYFCTIY